MLPTPEDRTPGFQPDPLSDQHRRWWDGDRWHDWTDPAGGPPLAHAAAVSDTLETPVDPELLPGSIASRAQKRQIVQLLKRGKYAKPFEEGRFAWISIVGTEDWQDYASTVVQMVEADTLLDLDERLAEQNRLLSETVGLLERIAQQLEQDRPSPK